MCVCVCVCVSLCTTVINTAYNSSGNFPSYPADNHHCSGEVYSTGEGTGSKETKMLIFTRNANCSLRYTKLIYLSEPQW